MTKSPIIIIPTEKSEGVESLIRATAGKDRRSTILSRSCMLCNQDAVEFRDELSRREYAISGMCQKCQDKVFGN